MAEDKLGRFLYENGVSPDDFALLKERIVGGDVAILETAHSKSLFMTDAQGQVPHKLVPELARLSLLRFNFNVRFVDGDTPSKGVSYRELAEDDPAELELISVEFYHPELEDEVNDTEEDAVTALFHNQGDQDDDNYGTPVFFSHDGTLLSTHPEYLKRDDPGQPPLLFE